jgi:PAS domain S-box-containing protein
MESIQMTEYRKNNLPKTDQIRVSGINIEWHSEKGICAFEKLPVAMMWVDTTLASVMSAVQAMVGTERFALALQSEGRKSVEADWQVISLFPDFIQGFKAIANIAAVAGWGHWELISLDIDQKECRFRVSDNWEGHYQKALGVCWGSGMLAGKLAGYGSKLFGTNCWTDQTSFIAKDEAYDEFIVRPSTRSIEKEIENLLETDIATGADMAVALQKLEKEIAERKRAEEALRDSEAIFRTQFEFGNIGIAITSTEKGWLRVNNRLCDMFGYSKDELVRKTWAEMTFPEDLAPDLAQFERILSGDIEAYELDKRFFRKDKSIISTHLTVSCFRNPDRTARFFIASFLDITERRLTEEKLKESENRFRSIVEAVPDAIFIADKTGKFVHVNMAACRQLGYRREELLQRTVFDIVPAEYIENIREHLLNMKGSPEFYESRHLRGDGAEIIVDICNIPIKFQGQTCLLGVARDITERKHLEEQLSKAEKMQALGILAGGVAHDLNNTLGPLVGYPELILHKLPDDSPVRRMIERIESAAKDAVSVIQDLLTLARRGRYDLKPTNINDVLTNYFDSPHFLAISGEKPRIQVKRNLDKDLPLILGSAAHLSKVIMNLVTNAYEAMNDLGRLTISTNQAYLSKLESGHECVVPGSYVILRVKDTGCGIKKDDIEKIFEPYFSRKNMGKSGTGLGLAVVYGVIKDHMAYYDVFSEIGKGTEFIAYFPVCRQPIKGGTETIATMGGNERILIVDDCAEQRDMASQMIASLGYQVDVADNGHQALSYLSQKSADVVVLDMIMEPGFDGLDTYREILKIRPGQKAIIMSGYSDSERVHQMQQMGAGPFIHKPYTLKTVAEALRKVMHSANSTCIANLSNSFK